MLNKRKWLIFAVAGFVVALLAVRYSQIHPKEMCVWTAPEGESVACVRTSAVNGEVLVGTQGKNVWSLYTIRKQDGIRKIVSSTGYLQSVSAISPPDRNASRCLIGLGRSGKAPWRLLVCDLKTGNLHNVTQLHNTPTFNLLQPFSNNNNEIVVIGKSAATKKTGTNCWLLDRKIEIRQMQACKSGAFNYVMWDNNDFCYVYDANDGKLFVYEPPSLLRMVDLPKAWLGFVLPSGNKMLLARNKPNKLEVLEADIHTGKYKNIYSVERPEIDQANIIGIQHLSSSHETIINVVGNASSPLYISSESKVFELYIPREVRWRLNAGVAFAEPGVIAVVRKKSQTARDEIIFLPVQPK